MGKPLALTLLLLVSAPAGASALHGTDIRVSLGGHRESGIGVHGDAHGWRLAVDRASRATSVIFIDQTAATRDKWVVDCGMTAAVVLDSTRFRGGHAYRVEVWRGVTLIDRGLVYLYPTRGSKVGRVMFDPDPEGKGAGTAQGASGDNDLPPVIPKSAL